MAHGISQEKLDEIGLEPEQVNGKEFLAPVHKITHLICFFIHNECASRKMGDFVNCFSTKFLITFKFQSTL